MHLIFVVIQKDISTRKDKLRYCSHFHKLRQWTLSWKPNWRANGMFSYERDEGF